MSTRTDRDAFDLDRALARLAAEASPGQALTARVLADAARVSAEWRPAAEAPRRTAAPGLWSRLAGAFRHPSYGVAGALATLALSLGLGLGYGYMNERTVLSAAGLDEAALAEFSPLDDLEREVIAAVDEDLFGLDAPL